MMPILLTILSFISVSQAEIRCHVTKTHWTSADERAFGEFITRIGESRCTNVKDCLQNRSVNPWASTDPVGTSFFADCADWPYYARAYFACKNGLPFSYVNQVVPADGNGGDIRYSSKGNRPTSRRAFTDRGEGYNLMRELRNMINSVSTAMYRMNPVINTQDFYSVDLDPRSISPGTVLYDPAGHAAIVYRVEPDGRIRYIDAHPDNSLTRGVYGQHFARSRPDHGAGFKNFRPQYLRGAQRNSQGHLIGGQISIETDNSNLPDYTLKQYFGTQTPYPSRWNRGRFILSGRNLDYYDYVRQVMAGGNLKYNPVTELSNMMDEVCVSLKERVNSVQAAIRAGIDRKPQPDRLPRNIYGTHGEWESYSTPSRDARLKTSFVQIKEETLKFVDLFNQSSPQIEYNGTDLRADLLDTYNNRAAACNITYENSAGREVTVGYHQIVNRLFDMSFDPYHCIELRWGAPVGTQEFQTCQSQRLKMDWYHAEAGLRNQIERTYDARMDFDLGGLQSTDRIGTLPILSTPPTVDLRELL